MVRHVATPVLAPEPQPHIVPVVAHVDEPIAAPKQEQHAAPAVIPVVQHQAVQTLPKPDLAPEKAPSLQKRLKTSVRMRGKGIAQTVTTAPVVAPTSAMLAYESRQADQLHVPAATNAVVQLMQAPTPKRERPARVQRAARGRVKEPLRWLFSYADVAAAAGVLVDRVRHAECSVGGKEPRLVMTDLRSVARFIEERVRQQRVA